MNPDRVVHLTEYQTGHVIPRILQRSYCPGADTLQIHACDSEAIRMHKTEFVCFWVLFCLFFYLEHHCRYNQIQILQVS